MFTVQMLNEDSQAIWAETYYSFEEAVDAGRKAVQDNAYITDYSVFGA